MRSISINHIHFSPSNGFHEFIAQFEKQLGHHDLAAYQTLLTHSGERRQVAEIIKQQEGTSGFMIFAVYDHGALLNIQGTPRQARQYVIGNPLYAARMTEHDIRAALYAPLRVLVYVDEVNRVQVEYDQPSTLFAQFSNPQIDIVARELDVKLANIVQESSEACFARGPRQ
jgi:uncharacterized protein (DUF302 family)